MKVLILTPRIFFPADTGGRIRSANMFREMSKSVDVTILCYTSQDDAPEDVEAMRGVCGRLELVPWHEVPTHSVRGYLNVLKNAASSDAFVIAKYATPAMKRRVAELLAAESYDLVVCDFLHMAGNLDEVDFRPRVLFQHNVEAVIRRRQSREAGSLPLKAYFWWDWFRLHRFEGRAGELFDHSIMVSDKDCETMARAYGIHDTSSIPLGVDNEFFSPSPEEADEATHLVFTGSMDWLPNQDATEFFVGEVMPRLREHGRFVFWVVGRNPPASIRALAEEHDDVEVTGTVDDIRPYLRRGHVYVVPLRIGGGTRIKIFEAMAMQRAVVSTSIGAEGLPVTHGEDCLIADTPQELADAIVALADDLERRGKVAEAGRRLVAENYSWSVAADRFRAICEDVVERASA